MKTRIASIRPICRLAFEQSNDERAALDCYHRYLLKAIEKAAACHPKAICLPEDCMMMMQAAYSETTSGPYFQGFQEAAAKHHTMLVVGLVLKEKSRRYNSTVIFNSQGKYVGRYDKTHLTQLEVEKYGISAGEQLSVFDTEIGRVGVCVCADILFPEVPRVLALKGAKVVFFPHQMAEPSEDFFSLMVRSRAQDNCMPIVCSNFADQSGRPWFKNWIVAADGCLLDEGPLGEGFSQADVSLLEGVTLRDYIEPGEVDLREIIFKYRKPALYQQIRETH